MFTPWGHSDHVDRIADGITRVGTPSHGGFYLSAQRLATMPERLLRDPFHAPDQSAGWFEEDCEWARVALAFPDCFPAEDVALAERILKRYHPACFA